MILWERATVEPQTNGSYFATYHGRQEGYAGGYSNFQRWSKREVTRGARKARISPRAWVNTQVAAELAYLRDEERRKQEARDAAWVVT